MTLDEYLSRPGAPSAAEFAARCNPPLSPMSISRIRKGRQNITRDTMLSIIAASGGMVTSDGLLLFIAPDDAAPPGGASAGNRGDLTAAAEAA